MMMRFKVDKKGNLYYENNNIVQKLIEPILIPLNDGKLGLIGKLFPKSKSVSYGDEVVNFLYLYEISNDDALFILNYIQDVLMKNE